MAQVSRHLLSTRPLPSTGDTIAMFDLERKLFLTATKSHNVKLTSQGEFLNEVRHAPWSGVCVSARVKLTPLPRRPVSALRSVVQGCLFVVQRVNKTVKDFKSLWKREGCVAPLPCVLAVGAFPPHSRLPSQLDPRAYRCGIAFQSKLNGRFVGCNFRGRLVAKDKARRKHCEFSGEMVVSYFPETQRDGTSVMKEHHPMRYYSHRANMGVGGWVQSYKSSIHEHMRLSCAGAYNETDTATLYDIIVVERADGRTDVDPNEGASLAPMHNAFAAMRS